MPQESQGPGCQPWTPVASSACWNLSCPGYSASAPSSKSWAEASVERDHRLPPWLPAFRRAGVWPQRLPARGRVLPLIKTHTRADKPTLKIEFKYADTSSQNPKKIGKLKHPPLHPHVLCRYKLEDQSPSCPFPPHSMDVPTLNSFLHIFSGTFHVTENTHMIPQMFWKNTSGTIYIIPLFHILFTLYHDFPCNIYFKMLHDSKWFPPLPQIVTVHAVVWGLYSETDHCGLSGPESLDAG